MSPRLIATTTVALAALVALGAALDAGARPEAPRIVDRTLVCPVGLSGGLHQVEARAASGVKAGASWTRMPFALVASAIGASLVHPLDSSIVSVTAGRPAAGATIDTDERETPVRRHGTLAIRTGCRASKQRVAFVSRGLQGGATSQLGDEYDCTVSERVLVRVRAAFETPPSFTTRDGLERTGATVREARLAVRSLTGKPIVYADVLESGRSRLFVAASCVPD
jgi:hypothetical protein